MANDVFANSREVACKAGDGKSLAAFPDVCMTPPENPATPPGVPVPYPNNGFASDLTEGSRSVQINGKEIVKKNLSYYKTSTGDEAGCAAKKGIVTAKITGTVFFKSWSFDVFAEGENVARHLDITTHNHGSDPFNPPPQVNAEAQYTPIQQEAKIDGPTRCECCGNLAHTENQAAGNTVTEEDFYGTKSNAKTATLLSNIRSSPTCKHILPDPGDKKCGNYYVTKNSREKSRIETDWGLSKPSYYEHMKIPKATDISHRVPKAAGGCPNGLGNLAPTSPDCAPFETQLAEIQGRRIQSLRKSLG